MDRPQRGVSSERKFTVRGKKPQSEICSLRLRCSHIRGFAQVGPCGEPGHVGVGETVAVEDDRDRISPIRSCCEDVYLCECPFPTHVPLRFGLRPCRMTGSGCVDLPPDNLLTSRSDRPSSHSQMNRLVLSLVASVDRTPVRRVPGVAHSDAGAFRQHGELDEVPARAAAPALTHRTGGRAGAATPLVMSGMTGPSAPGARALSLLQIRAPAEPMRVHPPDRER